MDNSENQGFRASKAGSRLPLLNPAGLQELNDSQHNARSRIATVAKPGLKRELPQPAIQSDAKRKPLSQQALEYPPKPSQISATPAPRTLIAPTTLVGASSAIRPPSRYATAATRPNPSSIPPRYNLTSSYGPESRAPERPKTSMSNHSRSVNGRPRAQTIRPQTAFSNHPEEEVETAAPKAGEPQHGTTGNLSLFRIPPSTTVKVHRTQAFATSHFRIPASRPNPSLSRPRNTSLCRQLEDLALDGGLVNNASASSQGSQVVPLTTSPQISTSPDESPPLASRLQSRPMQNVTQRRCTRNDKRSARHMAITAVTPPAGGGTTPPLRSGQGVASASQAGPVALPRTPAPDNRTVRGAIEQFHDVLKSSACIRTRGEGRSPSKSPSPTKIFLTKDSNLTNFSVWDVDGRLVNIEQQFGQLKSMLGDTISDRAALETTIGMLKTRVTELDGERERLDRRNTELHIDIEKHRDEVSQLRRQLDEAEWRHKTEVEAMARASTHDREDLHRTMELETERLRKSHQEELEALKRHYSVELEDERRERSKELQDLRARLGNEQQDLQSALQQKDREIQEVRSQLESSRRDVEREEGLKKSLQTQISELSAANVTMEARANSLRSQVEFLESDSKAQSDSFSTMEAKLQEANRLAEEARQKLIKEETERRVLFNKYQELKGNIRVMCRVRPRLTTSEGDEAGLSFPDDKTSAKIGVLGPEERSSLGMVSRKEYPFEFDRVFTPVVANEEIFGEISQLVQSALDGYNVCIFCYGQTGSGKTYTMSSTDGMIPRATHMIYETITKLKEKSWTYSMEGSFVEVYNEELNDLLTPSGSSTKKLEIRHDETRKQTTVLNCRTVSLDSADKVETMLGEAQKNRSVAATRANERSSRSHSVFSLRLVGENSATGERCEGTLNLVDLAGSERVKHSGAEGDRMREAQNINKSLACLGDVIDALGRGSAHVPYRNSKLTHLLQYSLGGNSKTLMFVMVSPLEEHLKETLTSLRFAAKVHNTHIGTAKATKKIRE